MEQVFSEIISLIKSLSKRVSNLETWEPSAATDPDAIHDNVSGEIAAVALKAAPATADLLLIEDSAAANAKKRVTITSMPVTDTTAIHDNVAGEINAIANKAVPVGADLLVIEDSAAANAKKKISISTLPITIPDIGARAYHNANQSIGSGAWTSIALNSERWDTDTIHDTAVNNSRLTCQTDGKYMIVGNAEIDIGAGVKGLRIYLNNTTVIAEVSLTVVAGAPFLLTVSTIYDLSATNYVELQAFQATGIGRNVIATANYSPEFMMQKIG